MNAEEHRRRQQWDASKWFAEHELLGEEYWNDGRSACWHIGQPGTCVYEAEILSTGFGSLMVHGDIPLCRFAHYGDHGDAWHRLLWMGDCTDVGYYVAQKAAIGMGGRNAAQSYNSQVARYDLDWQIAEARRDDSPKAMVALLVEAKRHVDEERALRHFLQQGDKGWDLWELDLGAVTASHVVVAHVALQRTVHLLRARYGAEGPPQCLPKAAE